MRTYVVIDDGTEVRTDIVETADGLRIMAKIGSLRIYGKEEIEKSIEKKVRILAYFGSQALHEIEESRAQYAELLLLKTPSRKSIAEKLRKIIRI